MEEPGYEQDKIFDSVKEQCGLNYEDTTFDNDLIMFINGQVAGLYQMGAVVNLEVTADSMWDELKDPSEEEYEYFPLIKQYMFLRVRTIFDPPPPNTFNILSGYIEELEVRILLSIDGGGAK